ncbi:MAG TPA: amidohydrolase family protein [Xanthobacteraceae bacterium]|nr:amidohydrolase family protein [Xanthobacteraceae bacterium]
MPDALDLVIRRARLPGAALDSLVDIGVRGGTIAAIAPVLEASVSEFDAAGRITIPGFVETHIHLDKSCIFDRCHLHEGTLEEAIKEVASAKRDFTEEDIYLRARKTLEKAIVRGTTRMRTHVEVDPRIGLKGFRAISRLKREYAWAVDLEICVFPQEGLLNDPGCDELLVAACEQGADLIGGCPYTDSDSLAQISRIFDLARAFDLDIDFHLDFDLMPERMDLDEICEQTSLRKWGGRVAIGHVTKLSAVDALTFQAKAKMLADAGVAVTVLPATDLFLMGRGHEANVPRGVTPAHKLLAHGVNCSLATNNVLNPFTPFGDCSLPRMANLYANVAQAGTLETIASCFEMITQRPAKLTNLRDYGISVGNPADFVILDCHSIVGAVAEIAQPIVGFKRGIKTFTHAVPELHFTATRRST